MSAEPAKEACSLLGVAFVALLLSACGGGGGGAESGASAGTGTSGSTTTSSTNSNSSTTGTGAFSLSATISGLDSSGLVLSVNGSSVSASTGTIASANGSVVVTCSIASYTVGGSITGLSAPGLVLQNSGADASAISADATTFTMPTPVNYGASYEVAVQTQPTGRVCSVSNGSGTMGAGNVTGITVACLPNTAILYSFTGAPGGGANSYASLIQGSNGLLYGTAEEGGSSDLGAVFVYDPSSSAASLLHSFVGAKYDGANPYAGLVADSAGNLYGTTQTGGAYLCGATRVCASNYGAVVKINPTSGAETLLHAFKGSVYADGEYPYDTLLLGPGNNLYGTTQKGGASGYGTVFRVNSSKGTETVLHVFAGGTGDGSYPYGGLIQASDGNLYGTTQQGGASGSGTVFRINPTTGATSIVYSFEGGS